MHAWRDTRGYAQRVYRKSNTHSVTDVHSHISCSIKHDAKRREQHSAIRWVLTDLLQRERETERYWQYRDRSEHCAFDIWLCLCMKELQLDHSVCSKQLEWIWSPTGTTDQHKNTCLCVLQKSCDFYSKWKKKTLLL